MVASGTRCGHVPGRRQWERLALQSDDVGGESCRLNHDWSIAAHVDHNELIRLDLRALQTSNEVRQVTLAVLHQCEHAQFRSHRSNLYLSCRSLRHLRMQSPSATSSLRTASSPVWG